MRLLCAAAFAFVSSAGLAQLPELPEPVDPPPPAELCFKIGSGNCSQRGVDSPCSGSACVPEYVFINGGWQTEAWCRTASETIYPNTSYSRVVPIDFGESGWIDINPKPAPEPVEGEEPQGPPGVWCKLTYACKNNVMCPPGGSCESDAGAGLTNREDFISELFVPEDSEPCGGGTET